MQTKFLLAIVAVVSLIHPTFAAAPARPNILFIFSDDHAAHAISAYGSKINQTPNLDRIATNGMKFTRCFVNNSICSPSRAAVLTGKYSHKNGVTVFNRFDGSQPHLAKYLQAAGYQTAIVGKWHLFSDPTGFDYWNILPGQGLYNNPVMIENGKTNKLTGYVSDLIGDISLDWLKNKRDPNKPFCLMSQPKAPHREWTPSAKYTNLFADIDLPEPPTFNDDYAGRSRALPEATMRMEHLRRTDLKAPVPEGLTPAQEKSWRYQRYIKDYLRCVASMDENVGRILDYLDQSGLTTNTIVIYSSDQGFFLGDHGWFDKRFMYEESLRMPLLVSWPGHIKPGSVSDGMVMNIDFAPTLLNAVGAPIPADMQGRSFLPFLRGEKPKDWRTSFYYRYYHYPADHQVQPHYGVRTDRYKLICYNKIDEWELYDLDKDRFETNNVYAKPSYAKTVAKLKTELARLRKEVDDRDQFAEELSNNDQFQPVPEELIFRPDFARLADGFAPDASGKGHRMKLTTDIIRDGRRGKSVQIDGAPLVVSPGAAAIDPSGKPFTVGAWCKPEKADGIIAAQGGASQGWALFLKEGVPQFAVRSGGKLTIAAGKTILKTGEWIHLTGTLNSRGALTIWIDGAPGGTAKSPAIRSRPLDVFNVGGDAGSAVVSTEDALLFRGQIEDLRLYWGALEKETIEDWMNGR